MSCCPTRACRGRPVAAHVHALAARGRSRFRWVPAVVVGLQENGDRVGISDWWRRYCAVMTSRRRRAPVRLRERERGAARLGPAPDKHRDDCPDRQEPAEASSTSGCRRPCLLHARVTTTPNDVHGWPRWRWSAASGQPRDGDGESFTDSTPSPPTVTSPAKPSLMRSGFRDVTVRRLGVESVNDITVANVAVGRGCGLHRHRGQHAHRSVWVVTAREQAWRRRSEVEDGLAGFLPILGQSARGVSARDRVGSARVRVPADDRDRVDAGSHQRAQDLRHQTRDRRLDHRSLEGARRRRLVPQRNRDRPARSEAWTCRQLGPSACAGRAARHRVHRLLRAEPMMMLGGPLGRSHRRVAGGHHAQLWLIGAFLGIAEPPASSWSRTAKTRRKKPFDTLMDRPATHFFQIAESTCNWPRPAHSRAHRALARRVFERPDAELRSTTCPDMHQWQCASWS